MTGDVSGAIRVEGGAFEVIPQPFVMTQQRLDLGSKPGIGTATTLEIGQAVPRRSDLQRVEKDLPGRLDMGIGSGSHSFATLVLDSSSPKCSATGPPDPRQENLEIRRPGQAGVGPSPLEISRCSQVRA